MIGANDCIEIVVDGETKFICKLVMLKLDSLNHIDLVLQKLIKTIL